MSYPTDGAAARGALLLFASILALAPASGLAAEEPAGAGSATAAGEGARTAAGPGGVSVPDGATVIWNAAAGRMAAPSAEQAAELAAAFRRLLLAKAAEPGFRRLARPGEVDEVLLPNGMTRARLSGDRMSFSIVRFDTEGRLIQSCADGAEAAATSLATPVSGSVESR